MIACIGDTLIWILENWFYISIVLSVVIVFFQRNEPESVWAWLLVLFFLPGVGFFLYLLLHQNFKKKHMFRVKGLTDASFSRKKSILGERYEITEPSLLKYNQLVRYNQEAGGCVYTEDNSVEIITDGEQKFERLISEIDKAEHYIHIQYYIIQNDELFQKIKLHLYRKVKEGVTVRILFDPLGCRSMKRCDWEELKRNGIQIGNFFPAMLGLFHIRINYRNHRKIVVIDGRVGFVGGYNIGREYISLDKKFGYWRDTHLVINGSAVFALQVRFALDWNYAVGENLFLRPHMFAALPRKKVTMQKAVQEAMSPAGENAVHKCGVQIISSGPDSEECQIRNNYVYIVSHARRSICIQTPYFIPDKTLMNALLIAVKSGVEVKLMIPCKPDHPFVYWATYSYMGELLKAGAKCYTYENGFLHAKGITVDEEIVCYGTANMDIRSFELNFEVNAVIYDRQVAEAMMQHFEADTAHCRQVTWPDYAKRGIGIRIKEQISRLLSPVL